MLAFPQLTRQPTPFPQLTVQPRETQLFRGVLFSPVWQGLC